MTKVTLTKALTKGEELVVIPKRTYDLMERVYRQFGNALTSDDVWREMEAEADADIKAGRVSKTIRTVPALKRALAKMKKPTLKTALANFTPDMVEHVNWGRNVGKEITA